MDFEFDNMPLGSIVISVDYVEEKSKSMVILLMKSLIYFYSWTFTSIRI